MPDITTCPMFGYLPILYIILYNIFLPRTLKYHFHQIQKSYRFGGGKCSDCLALHPAYVSKYMTLFPCRPWGMRCKIYSSSHLCTSKRNTNEGLCKVLEFSSSRSWLLPCSNSYSRILRSVGVLRYSETNLEPVCYQHRLFQGSGIR